MAALAHCKELRKAEGSDSRNWNFKLISFRETAKNVQDCDYVTKCLLQFPAF